MKGKKLWVLWSIFSCFGIGLPKSVNADHVLGSEIHCRDIGNDSLEIVVSVYRKCTDNINSLNTVSPSIVSDSCSS